MAPERQGFLHHLIGCLYASAPVLRLFRIDCTVFTYVQLLLIN